MPQQPRRRPEPNVEVEITGLIWSPKRGWNGPWKRVAELAGELTAQAIDTNDAGAVLEAVSVILPREYAAVPPNEVRHLSGSQVAFYLEDIAARRRGELRASTVLRGALHGPDFRWVNWFGTEYSFTDMQATCVRVFWEQWERGIREISEKWVLTEAESDSERLRDVFDRGRHPAFGKMIVPCSRQGLFALAVPRQF